MCPETRLRALRRGVERGGLCRARGEHPPSPLAAPPSLPPATGSSVHAQVLRARPGPPRTTSASLWDGAALPRDRPHDPQQVLLNPQQVLLDPQPALLDSQPALLDPNQASSTRVGSPAGARERRAESPAPGSAGSVRWGAVGVPRLTPRTASAAGRPLPPTARPRAARSRSRRRSRRAGACARSSRTRAARRSCVGAPRSPRPGTLRCACT